MPKTKSPQVVEQSSLRGKQPKNWQKMKLGDVTEIVSGGTPNSSKLEYWTDGDIPWATLPDLKSKYIFDTQRKITTLGLKKSSARMLPVNSVIFSSRATIGEISITKVETSTNQGSKNFICNPDKLWYEFLYYLLKSKVEMINGLATGATYKEINKTVFSSIEISLPNISTQKSIADILSTYDNLIENNTKRIKILEKIAQAIYKEWFVYFRFPGHEKAKSRSERSSTTGIKMVDSKTDFGKIPEGWLKDFEDPVDFKEGPGIRNYQYSESGIPFLNIRLIGNGEIDINKANFLNPDEVDKKYKHFLLQENDHVVSSSGTIGRLATVRKSHLPLCLNTSVIRMRPVSDRVGVWQLKHFLLSDYYQNQITAHASGAAQMNYGPMHLKQMHIIAPPESMGKQYEELTSPLEEEMKNLRDKNLILRQARDLLLPKLISGEIEIK